MADEVAQAAQPVTLVRLHLVDGTYELFRAHFSPRPGHRAPGGWDAKATVGIAASLLALLHDQEEAPTHVAVAFDNPIRSFRNDLFAGYKTEEGVPAELLAQFDAAEAAVRSLGLVVWSMREHEADDGLATGAARFREQVSQVRILTPDKDLAQCLRGDRVVQVDRQRRKVTDEASFRAARGFGPGSVPDFLALVGDTADGIPGLRGFGEKTAGLLLGAYERLERIPEDPARWSVKPRGAAELAATLRAGREEALLYRQLATLVETAPISATLEELRWDGVPKAPFERFCDELGVGTLRSAPRRWR
jgi:5'-3' exonuclease